MKKSSERFLVGGKHPYLGNHRPTTFHKPLVHGGGPNRLAICGLLVANSARSLISHDTILSNAKVWWPCGSCFKDEWKTWPQPPPFEPEEPKDYLVVFVYNAPYDQDVSTCTIRRVYEGQLLETLNELTSMKPQEGHYLKVIEITHRAEFIRYTAQRSGYQWEKETDG